MDRLLSAQEERLGIAAGAIQVLPIIETALGLLNAYDIARSISRVGSLHFGAGDFTRDLGLEWSRDERELLYARSHLVIVCRAAGVEAPTDSVWVRLNDDDGLADSAQRARGTGFQGKCCIQPRQVTIVNQAFLLLFAGRARACQEGHRRLPGGRGQLKRLHPGRWSIRRLPAGGKGQTDPGASRQGFQRLAAAGRRPPCLTPAPSQRILPLASAARRRWPLPIVGSSRRQFKVKRSRPC